MAGAKREREPSRGTIHYSLYPPHPAHPQIEVAGGESSPSGGGDFGTTCQPAGNRIIWWVWILRWMLLWLPNGPTINGL